MRKDWTSDWPCETQPGLNYSNKYAFYTRLENPSAQDTASLVDAYDQCMVANANPPVNYRAGN